MLTVKEANLKLLFEVGNVGKSRQRRSRHFAVLTYSMYAPRVNNGRALRDAASNTAALLDGLF
jgi:hypothetical protein